MKRGRLHCAPVSKHKHSAQYGEGNGSGCEAGRGEDLEDRKHGEGGGDLLPICFSSIERRPHAAKRTNQAAIQLFAH